jgi:hypothetical protein
MSNRFHNKYHRQNHHSARTQFNDNYIDAAYDPIASYEAPFEGEFYSRGEIITTQHLSAKNYVYADDGNIHNNLFVGNDFELGRDLFVHRNVHVKKNVEIEGNLSVLGTLSQLDTKVTISSATEIINYGTGPALKITQYGTEPIAHFIDINGDDIIFQDDGYVGLGTDHPNEKLTVVGSISTTNHLFVDKNSVLKQDLTVGGGVLFVDESTKRIGINSLNPNLELAVNGSISSTNDVFVNHNLFVGTNSSIDRVNVKGHVNLIASDTSTTAPPALNIQHAGTSSALSIQQTGAGNCLVVETTTNYPTIITSKGWIGVGTREPNAHLTVVGDISATGTFLIGSGSIVANSIKTNTLSSNQGFFNGNLQVGSNNTLYVDPIARRVGINTSSPSVDFEVQGKAKISQTIDVANATFTGETTIATSITADNLFLKLFVNGEPKYIRLFDIA